MLATVDALLPLSLLEAVRSIDTPSDQLDTEYVDELRNKRLGLSDTIYVQIKRHSEAARRGHRAGQDELIALAKLIGRRPDAEAVFRAAGRYMARQSYRTISPVTRKMMRLVPSAAARPLAFRHMRKIAARYLSGNMRRVGTFLLFEVPRSITLDTAPGASVVRTTKRRCASCCCCSSAASAAVEHVRCSGRGEGSCEWRADWRAFDRTAGLNSNEHR